LRLRREKLAEQSLNGLLQKLRQPLGGARIVHYSEKRFQSIDASRCHNADLS
jgi:hypothetical protein